MKWTESSTTIPSVTPMTTESPMFTTPVVTPQIPNATAAAARFGTKERSPNLKLRRAIIINAEIRTRAELFERELSQLQEERMELQRQLTSTQMDRDTSLNRLQLEVQNLEKALQVQTLRDMIDAGKDAR